MSKNAEIVFPDPGSTGSKGLIAAGGNLEVSTLILAYSKGIFPWFSQGSPILWWSPDPRMVLFPKKFRISKSLHQTIKSGKFEIKFDTEFERVIGNCARVPRRGQNDTWITRDMIKAYIRLHLEGYAHSVESYWEGKLAGGLYGVSLGRTFFGESMFYFKRDASKIALHALVEKLIDWEFDMIDVQQSTSHLKSLGAEEVSRKEFLRLLTESLKKETIRGRW
jgi:leucyl/phenylalanyl-tRNA--protein transferase